MQSTVAVGLTLLVAASALYLKEVSDVEGLKEISEDSMLTSKLESGFHLPHPSQHANKQRKKNMTLSSTSLTDLPGKVQQKLVDQGSLLAGNLASVPGVGKVMNVAGELPGAETLGNIASNLQLPGGSGSSSGGLPIPVVGDIAANIPGLDAVTGAMGAAAGVLNMG